MTRDGRISTGHDEGFQVKSGKENELLRFDFNLVFHVILQEYGF